MYFLIVRNDRSRPFKVNFGTNHTNFHISALRRLWVILVLF